MTKTIEIKQGEWAGYPIWTLVVDGQEQPKMYSKLENAEAAKDTMIANNAFDRISRVIYLD